MKRGMFLSLLIACTIIDAAFAGEPVGEISYLEGKISLTRNGAVTKDEPDFGTEIENFDTLATGNNGYLEAAIRPGSSMETMVKVKKNSTFWIDIASIGKNKKTTIDLLAGSVSLSVKKIAGTSVEVRTENAVMGVRGTDFDVSTAPGGELLVTCSTGKVECRNEDAQVFFAEPGSIVELIPGESFRSIPVAVSSIEKFRENWIADRIEIFKSHPLKAIQSYWSRYKKYAGEFQAAYKILTDHWDVISKWMKEDKTGALGGNIEIMKDKKILIAPILQIKKNLFIFEKIYYRMLELQEYFNEGYGRGVLATGESTAEVFRKLNSEVGKFTIQMSMVRYVMKMYAERNDGSVPGDDTETSAEDFFGSEESFFGS